MNGSLSRKSYFFYSINFIELHIKGKLMQLKNTRIALVLSNAVVTANQLLKSLFFGVPPGVPICG